MSPEYITDETFMKLRKKALYMLYLRNADMEELHWPKLHSLHLLT